LAPGIEPLSTATGADNTAREKTAISQAGGEEGKTSATAAADGPDAKTALDGTGRFEQF
jgi:hypothetical protein